MAFLNSPQFGVRLRSSLTSCCIVDRIDSVQHASDWYCFFHLFIHCFVFLSQGLWAYILRVNAEVKDKKISEVSMDSLGPGATKLFSVLAELSAWIDEIKVEPDVTGRFGNPAFRVWHQRLVERAPQLMTDVLVAARGTADLNSADTDAAVEFAAYLDTSFGNETRIDYGSGHEAHFCLLLHLMEATNVISDAEDAGVALILLPAYLRVTRKLQNVYRLEPAGSHGVWGLDDFSFIPFLWGSAQLVSSTRVSPAVIDDDIELKKLRHEYLYLDAILAIKESKTGPFHEHSPMLTDISRIPAGWPKINQGMIKMYKGEVWLKRQVVQAFLFGKLFPFCDEA